MPKLMAEPGPRFPRVTVPVLGSGPNPRGLQIEAFKLVSAERHCRCSTAAGDSAMRRIALLVLPLMTLFPLSASALTVRDVVELTRAGLGEDILLALIEVDPSVFPIDTETLKMLKEAGVSQR